MSFPRKEGKAKLFRIPKEVFTTESDNYSVSDLALAKGLEYLQNEDLVFGDLVEYEFAFGESDNRYRNDGLVIYDGEKLVNLYDNLDEYGSLHIIFQVIKNNVPLDYWDAIDHNSYVWFDVSPVYQELINNITQEGEIVFSHFYYDGKKYFIKMIEDANREDFEKCLSKCPVLPFSFMDPYEDSDYSTDTLYIDISIIETWLKHMENMPEYETYKIEKLHKSAKN
jgi:hypothetical protein